MVLPAQSKDLLPKSYQSLMIDPMSNIIEYYPKSYLIETTYKYYLWECQPILPYVISSTIKEATQKLPLTKDEKERNKLSKRLSINLIHKSKNKKKIINK